MIYLYTSGMWGLNSELNNMIIIRYEFFNKNYFVLNSIIE